MGARAGARRGALGLCALRPRWLGSTCGAGRAFEDREWPGIAREAEIAEQIAESETPVQVKRVIVFPWHLRGGKDDALRRRVAQYVMEQLRSNTATLGRRKYVNLRELKVWPQSNAAGRRLLAYALLALLG